jgi:hypothetical protein
MDVTYLFYDNKTITIPMYQFDAPLFQNIARRTAACFDYAARRFCIKDTPENRKAVDAIVGDLPHVKVGEIENGLISIRNFFATEVCGKNEEIKNLSTPVKPPELFFAEWGAKLKTELNSRKYSHKTIQTYLHYNKDLCQKTRKRPESITPNDIKQYLNFLESSNSAASSMNLAISALKFFYAHLVKKDIRLVR